MNKIYTVTAIAEDGHDSRCFGFFWNLSAAMSAAKENRCDLSECYYHYLVIEEQGEGIHAMAKQIQWFFWHGGHELRGGEEGCWLECDSPNHERFVGICNWNKVG